MRLFTCRYTMKYCWLQEKKLKQIFFEEILLSKMQKRFQGNGEQISEADVDRAFSPVVLHEGLHELLKIHNHTISTERLNVTSDGRFILVGKIVRNRIAYISLMTFLQEKFNFGGILLPLGHRHVLLPSSAVKRTRDEFPSDEYTGHQHPPASL